jgi:ribosomal protein S12 methylthiotransferase accessory factor
MLYDNPQRLTDHLLRQCAHAHTGLVPAVHLLENQASDWPGIFNAAVPEEAVNSWQTISGAVGLTPEAAQSAAIGEALERHAAALAPFAVRVRSSLMAGERILDETVFAPYSAIQRAQSDFPWPMCQSPEDLFAAVYDLSTNAEVWVPQEWVGLGPRRGVARLPSTSSGLAACPDAAEGPWLGILRAAQEVLERDALTCTWLNGLGGRQIALPESLQAQAASCGADVSAYDLTQVWNPHPVIAVAGGWPVEGHLRHAFGIACRSTREAALTKAWQEWAQGLTFAAHQQRQHADAPKPDAAALRRFDEHAVFYTLRPECWSQTAFIRFRSTAEACAPNTAPQASPHPAVAEVDALRQALAAHGIALYYRELTTPDVAAAGVRVFRVLAPMLSALHADERAPFLGGRCQDVDWRYPGATSHTLFPNPLPHPLG